MLQVVGKSSQDCFDKVHADHLSPLPQRNTTAALSIVSPPVLKQVKNMAMHEKYIKKVLQREAKRQVANTLSKKISLKGKGSSQVYKESEKQAIASHRLNTGLCVRRSPRFSTHLDNQAQNGQEALSNTVKAGIRIEKRLTRSSYKNKIAESIRSIDDRKKAPVVKNKTKGKCLVSFVDVERVQMMGANDVKQPVGVKRKMNEVKETHGVNDLWTKDQEKALQKAYSTVKPTPHFWKNVAKLVVGKSAQDCFDKIQDDYLSPLLRPKRRNTTKPSSLSISTSNFLSPMEKNTRKPKIKKTNARKTVRKLLQQHYLENQKEKMDLENKLRERVLSVVF